MDCLAIMRRFSFIVLLLAATVTGPILLRRENGLARAGKSDDRLVIITPHSNTIRTEFGEAFARHWQAKAGRSLYIDWRVPGGASEIRRVLDSSYAAAASLGNKGAGIDVFFGGGSPEFANQASKGRLEPLEVFATNPEWFQEEVIPAEFTGEIYYDKDRRWVGVCLFQLGICYNRDVLARLGMPEPQRWEDLGDPAYAGNLAFADPTKSGSVGIALEMMLQEQMQDVLRERGDSPEAREEGWRRGLNLLQKLAANARYFTDSASQVPYDVAQGDAAAGTCIDYYGRSFEEKLRNSQGGPRLRWIAPRGGSSVSVDPVAVLSGAPRPDIAQEFVRFCLSDEGQLLWNLKLGEPGGPRNSALRRLPVRRNLYAPEHLRRFSDPDAMPYERDDKFVYRKGLTGGSLQVITAIFRAMCMDPHGEMKSAWMAMNQTSRSPESSLAGGIFFDVSHVSYARMNELVPLFAGNQASLARREMTAVSAIFRKNYLQARDIATKERNP
ncbi:ABC transporter substrate-binding protein [Luteolibacter sp. Populi]|uniref:ABC transporter substrate-binding protein n=1 Tax=Luteolibacter sp. Populi TaxID=3230487 RepID=UPI003466C286